MHADRKKKMEDNLQTWQTQKGVVLGMHSRYGQVRMQTITKARKKSVQIALDKNVERGSTISTDEAHLYKGIQGYNRISVNHSVGEYLKGMATRME